MPDMNWLIIPNGWFLTLLLEGKCAADAESKVLPVLVGIGLTGLVLTVVVIYTVDRRKTSEGYEAV